MREKVLGIKLAKEIAKGLGPIFNDAVLMRSLRTVRDPSDIAGGLITQNPSDPQTQAWTCKAFVSTASQSQQGQGSVTSTLRGGGLYGDLISRGERKVTILGGTLPDDVEPQPNDYVTINGSTYYINSVNRIPGGATFVCSAKAS